MNSDTFLKKNIEIFTFTLIKWKIIIILIILIKLLENVSFFKPTKTKITKIYSKKRIS